MVTALRMSSRSFAQFWFTACALALALSFAVPVRAESQTFGEYTVHYIAVNSTFITPTIAQQYNITRGDRRAFLNIAVLHNNSDGSTTPVSARVSGGKQNLMQQTSDIDFVEIREGESIYYIGQFEFSNAETLRFAIDVQPEGENASHQIEWTTQLYSQ